MRFKFLGGPGFGWIPTRGAAGGCVVGGCVLVERVAEGCVARGGEEEE